MISTSLKITFFIPGDINTPTGGYRYDRAMLGEWRELGLTINLVELSGDFPFPSTDTRNTSLAMVDELAAQADVILIDGLASGTMPEFVAALSALKPVVLLVHHPLCLENGLNENQRETLRKTEDQALQHAKAVVTTSPATANIVCEMFGIAKDHVHTVLPGVERSKMPRRPTSDGNVKLLCVGSIIERKGHDFLFDALATIPASNWSLDLVGMMDIDSALTTRLKKKAKALGLDRKISFRGTIGTDEIEEAYAASDVFVLPSLYEGYGMAYAEAIVRGLPVIGTTAGAIPDTVPASCGILVPPGDVAALADAIQTMVSSPEIRKHYGDGAIAAEPGFPDWERSAKEFAEILGNAS